MRDATARSKLRRNKKQQQRGENKALLRSKVILDGIDFGELGKHTKVVKQRHGKKVQKSTSTSIPTDPPTTSSISTPSEHPNYINRLFHAHRHNHQTPERVETPPATTSDAATTSKSSTSTATSTSSAVVTTSTISSDMALKQLEKVRICFTFLFWCSLLTFPRVSHFTTSSICRNVKSRKFVQSCQNSPTRKSLNSCAWKPSWRSERRALRSATMSFRKFKVVARPGDPQHLSLSHPKLFVHWKEIKNFQMEISHLPSQFLFVHFVFVNIIFSFSSWALSLKKFSILFFAKTTRTSLTRVCSRMRELAHSRGGTAVEFE